MARSTFYISQAPNLFYKGQSKQLEVRFKNQNLGKNLYTATHIPWELLWVTNKESREGAMNLEKKLKNLSSIRLLEFMIKYEEGLRVPMEYIEQL